MKKILFCILAISSLLSCTKDDVSEDIVENKSLNDKKEYFIKNTDRKIVNELPTEVFNMIISDLKKQKKTDQIDFLNSNYKKENELTKLVSPNNNVTSKVSVSAAGSVSFQYMAHIAFEGWTAWTNLGSDAGIVGLSRRLEALQFSASTYLPDFRARAWVEKSGWRPYVGLGEVVGSVGEGRRAEAFQIFVPQSFATNVYYQVHVEKLGWLPLVNNGEIAGTMDQSRRAEAFRMYMFIL